MSIFWLNILEVIINCQNFTGMELFEVIRLLGISIYLYDLRIINCKWYKVLYFLNDFMHGIPSY